MINKDQEAISVRKQSGSGIRSGDKKLPLVTIIVPVYNVRAYVGECIESLLNQTYTNLEIILVDDGSTDGSEAVCDEYAKKDSRIRVIHQENQGPAAARNAGLDHASGEYVTFVDSDDVVASVFIEKLYKLLKKYHADIAACGYVRDPGNAQITRRYVQNRRGNFGKSENMPISDRIVINDKHTTNDTSVTVLCMSSEQMLRQWHGRYKKYETVVWNKLYHISIFNGDRDKVKIRYPIRIRDEDMLISHLIVENADRIVLTTQVLYRYRCREGSITARTALGEGVGENLSAQRERMAYFRKKRYFRAYLNLLKGYVLHRVWFGWKNYIKRLRKGW